MTEELTIGPADSDIAERLADAPAWGDYVTKLRDMLWKVVNTTGTASLEVVDLLVPEPLPETYSTLRNGVQLDPEQVISMVENMLAGVPPYCRFNAPRLHISVGYNGNVNIFVNRDSADRLAHLEGGVLSMRWNSRTPDFPGGIKLVDASADDKFWTSIKSAAETAPVLLCERWAFGAYGCDWFLLTPANINDVSRSVQPRSLLRSAIDPDLHINPALLGEDFTAFRAPLAPGRLQYAAFHWGVDDPQELVDQGLDLMICASDLRGPHAVVPDADGVVRGVWEA
uniref:hypothetical protein n=1 Tax=Nonomuraea sp. CA-252377 TaxID=3240003 RepID=UPI003F49752D